ncbi:hypothetical protein GGI21_000262 [Coemansia aciculifera]|nr:hypothetical protein GGI21_000262 [Coemansia aciculifera]
MSELESVTPPTVTILQREKQQPPSPSLPTSAMSSSSSSAAADQILLDALCKSTDRAFLLDVEQQIIDFVDNLKQPRLSFPKQNSYRRLLLHKLADYYTLSHVVAGRYRDEIVFYRRQTPVNSASEWSISLPELLSTVVPPECVVIDDAVASSPAPPACAADNDLDELDSAAVSSPVTTGFTKILVKKRNPADGADSRRRTSAIADTNAVAASSSGLKANDTNIAEDTIQTKTTAPLSASSLSAGVDACCEKLAAASVGGGRTKTIEQRQAEYERARAEIFQDDDEEAIPMPSPAQQQ